MKILFYSLGIITGVGLSFLYFKSSTLGGSSRDQIQLMEKSEKVESLTKKNTEIVRQNDILTEKNFTLSETNTNLELQVYGYKERDKAEKKKYSRSPVTEGDIKYKLRKYITGIGIKLTETQELKIREWVRKELEFWRMSWAERRNLKGSSPPNVIEQIKSILSDEQLDMYESHFVQKNNTMGEALASVLLGDYPQIVELSEEQKDLIYQNLYKISHPDTQKETIKIMAESMSDLKDTQIREHERMLLWAAEEVLSVEQIDILMQSFEN